MDAWNLLLSQGSLLMTSSVAVLFVVLAALWLIARPQRGVLLLAALVPYDGLLLLLPAPAFLNGWKEALVLGTLAASLMCSSSRPLRSARVPVWTVIAGCLFVYAAVSAVFAPPVQAVQAMKIGFFYLLVLLIIIRNPLTARDRHNLVTILMVNGMITALYGLAQQILGEDRLAAMGYEYNETIRTAGGFLRSFSTFNQPFGFGLFLMFVLLVAGSVALSDVRSWRNATFLITSPILVAAMATSVVRGAYLGLALGILVLATLRYRSLFLLAPLGAVVLLTLPQKALGAVFSSSSLGERGSGWGLILDDVIHHPFGIGLGSTGSVAEKVAELTGARVDFYQPDSQYVKTLLELGIIGLWLIAALLITGTAFAYTTARLSNDPDSALALGITAAMVAVIGASAVSTYLEIFPMDFYFWLSLGVLICIRISGSMPWRFVPEVVGSRPISANS